MTDPKERDEIEITPEMIAAGEYALASELGGAVTSCWEPRDLAIAVFRAMLHPSDSEPLLSLRRGSRE